MAFIMDQEFQFKLNFLNDQSESLFNRDFGLSRDVCNFIACQFALESDFGCSKLSVLSSNISGMKIPHRRYSLAIDSCDGFAVYRDRYDCKSDFLLWIFYNRPYQNQLSSVDSFIIFLRDSGYCPEKDYITKIQSIYSQFKSYFNESKS